MPDEFVASEYGGKPMANRVQPPITPVGTKGHTELTASEKLMLVYTTGDETGKLPPDGGASMEGVLTDAESARAHPAHVSKFRGYPA